jgi:hypothetical protein
LATVVAEQTSEMKSRLATFSQAVLSLTMDQAVAVTRRLRPVRRQIQTASGVLLVVMGLLLVTNRLYYLAIWAQRNGLYLDLQWGQAVKPYDAWRGRPRASPRG